MQISTVRIKLAIVVTALLLVSIPKSACAQSGAPSAAVDPSQLIPNGSYYALVIGINDYSAPLPKLLTAVSDAKSMAQVLRERYGFQVNLLIDRDATRNNILQAIAQYRNRLNEKDNLLIYYAGHGYTDHRADKTYWIPVDADSVYSPNRIIADELTTDIRIQSARHVLIVSDSCYSGGLTRDVSSLTEPSSQTAFLNRMLQGRSRTLMASGGDEPVSDGGEDGHSVFAYALLRALQETTLPVFTAGDLFYSSVRQRVAGNSRQLPQYSPIRDSSHDDGDFVFARKSESQTTATPASAEPSPLVAKGAALADQKRFAEAATLYRQACDAGDGHGCTSLGTAFSDGSGVAKNQPESARLFRLACDNGDARGCDKLGFAYQQGLGVNKDVSQSAQLFRQSCDAKDPHGCGNLGYAYARGFGVEKDYTHAVELFRQACDDKYLPACSNLGFAYENGYGVEKDEARAVELFRQTCDGDDATGCRHLAYAFQMGSGVHQDATHAATLYRKACDGKDGTGCTNLAILYQNGTGVDEDKTEAAKFFSIGCDLDNADACFQLARLCRDGSGVAKDPAQANQLNRRACALGLSSACTE